MFICSAKGNSAVRSGFLPTILLDSSRITLSWPSRLIPILSKVLTIMATKSPITHSSAPKQQNPILKRKEDGRDSCCLGKGMLKLQLACRNQLKEERKNIWSHFIPSPPQSVHCIPYSFSKLCVTKKLRTEPRRETLRVRPKAKPSSLSLNQIAVMRSCNTGENKDRRECYSRADWRAQLVKCCLPKRDVLPDPKRNLPMSISGSRCGVPSKWDPSAHSEAPEMQRKENTYSPTRRRKKWINHISETNWVNVNVSYQQKHN